MKMGQESKEPFSLTSVATEDKLPDDQERRSLLKKLLADSGGSFSQENFEQLVVKTKG